MLIGFIITTILIALNIGFVKIFPENMYLFSWPITVNFFVFFLYWFDKRQSIKNGIRMPNSILYVLAITGGIVGSLTGMYCFRHKTKKIIYILNMWVIFIVYLIVFYAWFNWSELQVIFGDWFAAMFNQVSSQ
jgi:uncharacterized membrane protein YsdA (DUF1294 family)